MVKQCENCGTNLNYVFQKTCCFEEKLKKTTIRIFNQSQKIFSVILAKKIKQLALFKNNWYCLKPNGVKVAETESYELKPFVNFC